MPNSSFTENTGTIAAVCVSKRHPDDHPAAGFATTFLDCEIGGGHDTPEQAEEEPSAYLLLLPGPLRRACQDAGRDQGGRNCPGCALRVPCESQAARWSAASRA